MYSSLHLVIQARSHSDINVTSVIYWWQPPCLAAARSLPSNSLSRRSQACTHSKGIMCRRAILVHEFIPIDVTQALEEGQRAKCVGVSDLHVARHSLDQSHEALQLRLDVIWGQGMNINTH